ncbi:glutamine--tRNA ligase/YqeY domain fusion protein [Agathobaculum sp.]|uniref:glutamine--tRNA ligase/YqeY domain fusion protein n=1 Tax=Agathobaculum sp. TaxID=2048138 RepID=UPI002A81EABE|nr:glutamine--tRNA ligase/YqeY domain fusion protein [Agathobaculum sp.]MDY3619339.1 glutamine--tRNA ligase/YqeY domain fusion protein [Agathobaculum sp.]
MMENVNNFLTEIIDEDIANGLSETIHTRFPPEPNGYLHIGSAKAIFINWSIAKKYGGKFNLRYDDTNPVKEDTEYVDSIWEDIKWLTGEEPNGGVYYGSDYFETCYECACALIRDGKAYVDDLTQEEMRAYRGTLTEPGRESPYRSRTPEENLALFEDMRAGKFPDGTKTLRAKIDMASPNMNLRDPAIYRIVRAHHHRQGDRWCIYPLYDFAHPIQDAIEGITHSMCSIEFENHRPLYEWVVENCPLPHHPKQREFARLNITNTVMSKRYLRELVETGRVEGWDDPRMPTLCALRRRGYTPSAILDFVQRAGIAKANSLVDIKLLEHCIREELNKTALRRMAVLEPVRLVITNYPADKTEYFEVPNNPQDENAGTRKVPFTGTLYIEKSDFSEVPPPKFQRLKPDGEVRLMGAYIVRCSEVIKDGSGEVIEIRCTADLETGNSMPADGRKVKGTIHWVSEQTALDAEVCLYENLFTLENTGDVPEGTNYLDFLNPDSLKRLSGCKLEPSVAEVPEGTRMQFVRMGYFVKDREAGRFNRIVTLKDSFAKTLK